MMHEEQFEECGPDCCSHQNYIGIEFEKDYHMALLEKKEKIMEAKLEFLKKLREIIKKSQEAK